MARHKELIEITRRANVTELFLCALSSYGGRAQERKDALFLHQNLDIILYLLSFCFSLSGQAGRMAIIFLPLIPLYLFFM